MIDSILCFHKVTVRNIILSKEKRDFLKMIHKYIDTQSKCKYQDDMLW